MLMIDVGLIGLRNSKYTCMHEIYLLYRETYYENVRVFMYYIAYASALTWFYNIYLQFLNNVIIINKQ